MSMLVTLIRHRATWRFLYVLLATLGCSLLVGDLSKLEVALCSVLSCLD